MTRRLAALAVVTAAMGLIGCGDAEDPNADEKPPPFYHDLKQITVSLRQESDTRYLQIVFTLGIDIDDKEQAEELLAKKTPELRDQIIVYLSNLPAEKLTGEDNLLRVRKDVRDIVNRALGVSVVEDVLLKRLVMQQ